MSLIFLERIVKHTREKEQRKSFLIKKSCNQLIFCIALILEFPSHQGPGDRGSIVAAETSLYSHVCFFVIFETELFLDKLGAFKYMGCSGELREMMWNPY